MPTATATEFSDTAGMSDTALFQNASSARQVAEDGYEAMMAGEMDAFGGMKPTRRLQYFIARHLPKRTQLRIVRKSQETG